MIREPDGEPDRRAGMVELVFARVGNLAQLGVGDRLEVAAFLVGGLAVGRLDGERAPVAPQDVDQRQLFERQIVDPKRALSLAPEAGVEVGLVLVQAVEDDLDPLPVLGWFQASLVEGELSSGLARRRAPAAGTSRSGRGRGSSPSTRSGRRYGAEARRRWVRRTLGERLSP